MGDSITFGAGLHDGQKEAPPTICSETLQSKLSGSAHAFCNWLVNLGKIFTNPMAKVERSETRGQERRKRRVLTEEELKRLCAGAGPRALVYAFAFYTGIRRNELRNLLTVQFDICGEQMWINVRAAISKNREEVRLPIHHALLPRLKKHLVEPAGQERLFANIPRCDTLRADLKKAGIPYKDSEGRQADFHALRHATSTHLGANHAAPRAQMGMMRHHDMKLTMSTYTDETQIPLREAIEKLPDILGDALTHQLTHKSDVSGPDVSQAVATEAASTESQTLFMQGNRRIVTPSVASGRKTKKAAALGLEPAAHFSQVVDSVAGRKRQFSPYTHGCTHDPDLALIIAHWYDFPVSLRRQFVLLSRSWPQEKRP